MKIRRKNIPSIFFVLVMFLPVHSFSVYFILVTLLALIGLSICREVIIEYNIFQFVVLIIVYLLFGSLVRYIFLRLTDIRDFIEIGRFLPVYILLIFSKYYNKIDYGYFVRILRIYIFVDFIVSFAQFNNIKFPGLTLIERTYSSSLHVGISLGISRRSLGLSMNPSEHGLVILVVIAILLITYLKIITYKI